MKLISNAKAVALAIIATGLPASATVTVTFTAPFTGGVASNLADADGNVQDGLVWGIIVDSTGNGISTSYDADFSLTQGGLIALTSGGLATDDSIFISLGVGTSHLTSDTSGFNEGDFSTPGGIGGITGFSDGLPSMAGLNFALVWFDDIQSVGVNVDNGTSFGFITDGSFVLPSDGNTGAYDALFVGVDPVRAANGGTFVSIPEPSSALLLLAGAAGLFIRRKR